MRAVQLNNLQIAHAYIEYRTCIMYPRIDEYLVGIHVRDKVQ